MITQCNQLNFKAVEKSPKRKSHNNEQNDACYKTEASSTWKITNCLGSDDKHKQKETPVGSIGGSGATATSGEATEQVTGFTPVMSFASVNELMSNWTGLHNVWNTRTMNINRTDLAALYSSDSSN